MLGVAAVVSYVPYAAGGRQAPPPDWLIAIVEPGIVLLFCLVLVSIAAVPVRWRRAGPTERQQLKWFLVGAIWVALGTLLLGPLGVPVPAWLDALINVSMFLALPGAAAVAILRYRLYDVDLVLNRTLLYAGVSALLAGVYVV